MATSRKKQLWYLWIARDERNYNVYTATCTPWNEAKELKEKLRIKLKRVLLNV